MSLEVIFDLDENEKAKDASMVYDFGDTELANTFCEAYKQTTDASKVSCSGTKITIKGIDDSVDETDESEKMIGKTKEEIIAAAKEDGFSCK